MQDYGIDGSADMAATGLETVMWTRELAKRLLLPRADMEGLEDLLDTYFMLVSSSQSRKARLEPCELPHITEEARL